MMKNQIYSVSRSITTHFQPERNQHASHRQFGCRTILFITGLIRAFDAFLVYDRNSYAYQF